eukprot:5561768-Pyramimonas_sp.AAC.1
MGRGRGRPDERGEEAPPGAQEAGEGGKPGTGRRSKHAEGDGLGRCVSFGGLFGTARELPCCCY